tara:strand:+ start:658 stop:807 length:150 start_codon:yes stop_codon:yes gene_type:complete
MNSKIKESIINVINLDNERLKTLKAKKVLKADIERDIKFIKEHIEIIRG